MHYPPNAGAVVQVPAGEGGAGIGLQAHPAPDGHLPVLLQLRHGASVSAGRGRRQDDLQQPRRHHVAEEAGEPPRPRVPGLPGREGGLRGRRGALPGRVRPGAGAAAAGALGKALHPGLSAGRGEVDHHRQGCPRLQLHPDPRHVRAALRPQELRVRPPRRIDVHQEAGQDRGSVQRPDQRSLHLHALKQGGRLRTQPHRGQQVTALIVID